MKKVVLSCICILLLLTFSSCDPVLPDDNIVAECVPNPLGIGETASIDIKYPNISNTAITSWGQPDITVISGYDIVSVSELSVTGLAKGQATLKIEIVANCSFMGIVINKPVYTVNLTVLVE